jgi:hypothetical protein
MPSHGTETCAVVEMIFSQAVNHEVIGDATFADRCEVVTYNALPGSMTKGTSCDLARLAWPDVF